MAAVHIDPELATNIRNAECKVADLSAQLASAQRELDELRSLLPGQEWRMWDLPSKEAEQFAAEKKRIETVSPLAIGYPSYNGFKWNEWTSFSEHCINNIGSANYGGMCPRDTKLMEREVLSMAATALGTNYPEKVQGYVTTGGSTEGSLWALYMARERLGGNPVCFFAESTHYSVKKIVNMLKMEAGALSTDESGRIDVSDFRSKLMKLPADQGCIVVCNIGTTWTGVIDDVKGVKSALMEFAPGRHLVHADAALLGLYLPFVAETEGVSPCDFTDAIDSIAISGHKMLGVAMPCSIALATNDLISNSRAFGESIEYVPKLKDVTVSGSRNGHVVAALWGTCARLFPTGRWPTVCQTFLSNTNHAYDVLAAAGLNPWREKGSIIVLFDRPADWIVKKYDLMAVGERAHVTCHSADPYMMSLLLEDIKKSGVQESQ